MEWNETAMNEAIDTHDRVMRALLSKFSGYEVATEGDAFLMAFHDAADAVAWCTATQQVGWAQRQSYSGFEVNGSCILHLML